MNYSINQFLVLLVFVTLSACSSSNQPTELSDPQAAASTATSLLKHVAATPPMGWNSFDAYDSRITEKEYRATVEFMAEHLKDHGWEYAVIDYIWWNPDPGGYNTKENHIRRYGHAAVRLNEDGSLKYPEAVTMDKYGRLLPAPNRFPSAANGQGFKPLADWVHSKGLKFGIHIMRGIHRHAYFENTQILGADKTAQNIAKVDDHARWLNNMFGVDHRREGAQEYYNSIFKLYAEWGVDYIKADDMMGSCRAPFYGYSAGEIEMMRKGIDNSGRPMVLSLSCGESPIAHANHLRQNANMWRISADFWDEWKDLHRSFELLDKWSPFIGDHTWPDADMIPFGHISLTGRPHGPDRMSMFTKAEHYTLMSLFSIARSPLMIGADLLTTPTDTINTFFKNREVIYINQHSVNNRQVIRLETKAGGYAVWIAEDPKNGDYFVGLFNLNSNTQSIAFDFDMEDLRGEYQVRDLWSGNNLGKVQFKFAADIEAHGAGLYRLSRVPGSNDLWIPPKLRVATGNR